MMNLFYTKDKKYENWWNYPIFHLIMFVQLDSLVDAHKCLYLKKTFYSQTRISRSSSKWMTLHTPMWNTYLCTYLAWKEVSWENVSTHSIPNMIRTKIFCSCVKVLSRIGSKFKKKKAKSHPWYFGSSWGQPFFVWEYSFPISSFGSITSLVSASYNHDFPNLSISEVKPKT